MKLNPRIKLKVSILVFQTKLQCFGFKGDHLRDSLTALFNVSLRKLSQTISGTLYHLALYPNEQTKVKTEIATRIGHKTNINWQSLRNLSYTEAFIKEVLRLTGPVQCVERIVTSDCHLDLPGGGQLKLTKGQHCSLLIAAVHRDPQLFPEPNRFKPTRFLDENNPKTDRFLAFGFGSRTCIGQYNYCHTFQYNYNYCRPQIQHVLPETFPRQPFARV